MEDYITFRDKDEDEILQYYILQRDFPHYIGLLSEKPIPQTLACVPVSGYNLWVVFEGTLRGNMIPGYKDVADEILWVFEQMAQWFRATRINTDSKRYNKFIIKS